MNKAFIRRASVLFIVASFFGFSRLPMVQAAEKSVEQEILDILKEKEVIPQWQYEELKKKAEKEAKGANQLFSAKGWKLDIGGALELEYLFPGDDAKNPDSHFQLDKFVLKPVISSDSHDISMWAEAEFNDEEGKVSSFAVEWKNLPLESKLSTGLLTRFIGANRKTEIYPMLGTAIWRYEYYQMRWEAGIKPFYWGISFGEGPVLGTKQVGEDSSYKMLKDGRNTGEKTGAQEWGIKLGVTPEIGVAKLDILGYAFRGELDTDNDIKILQKDYPEYTSSDDNQNRCGGRVTLKYEGLTLMGEVAKLEDGDLDRNGWYTQASYKFKTGNKPYLLSIEPLVRYGEMNVDWPRSFDKSATWDRKTTVLAVITELTKNVFLNTEYHMLDEETGGKDVDNNEFLVQLKIKF